MTRSARRLRWPVAVLFAVLLGAGAWAIGFARFERAARQPGRPVPDADGIVALTGGAERIDTAIHLFADGRAPELLISGVGRHSDLAELARRAQLDPAVLGAHVTLGHAATSTTGNAEETAAWARSHAIRRLIVVTAGYHMPRALIEIGRQLPEATLYPVPVQPPAMREASLATLRLLAGEYNKFLAVRLGLSDLLKREMRR